MARNKIYPYNLVRECLECGRFFVRRIARLKQVNVNSGFYCCSKCKLAEKERKKEAKILARKHREDLEKFKEINATGRRTIESIPGPTAYEQKLWR